MSGHSEIRRLAALILVIGLGVHAVPAGASPTGAQAFVQNLGDEILTALGQRTVSEREAYETFQGIFSRGFDVPWIGRFVLGRYWRVATSDQQGRFIALFEEMVVQNYMIQFSDLRGVEFEVTGAEQRGQRNDVFVTTAIRPTPEAKPALVDWVVRPQQDDGYRIIDVRVEGISMGITQRREFASVIQRNGGRIDPLLVALQEKVLQNRQ